MLTARKDRMTITVLTGENCFKFNVELNRHVGSHTGAKPYSCRVVIITENYQKIPKTYRKLNYRKLTLTLNLTLTLTVNPKPYKTNRVRDSFW